MILPTHDMCASLMLFSLASMENLCPWPLEISAQSYIQLDLFCEGFCSQSEQREWEKATCKPAVCWRQKQQFP